MQTKTPQALLSDPMAVGGYILGIYAALACAWLLSLVGG